MNADAPRPRAAGSGRVLVVNAGSSSLKVSVVEPDDTIECTSNLRWADAFPSAALAEFVHAAGPVEAVGHRVVHGGADFTGPARLDPHVYARITALRPLAPLHQDRALAGIDAIRALCPDLPAVACFDTAFHRTLPTEAHTYALPEAWRARWGLRRYGFHGLSHAYASARASELAGLRPSSARVVSCHLGAGASLAAVRGGVCVDTTMGFTPAEGLVMATRAGDLDPGMLVWLLRNGIEPDDLERVLEHEAGLAALAGHDGDMRAIRADADAGDPRARSARAIYAYRVRTRIAGMAAAMGGLDVLAFTGGVGEHDDTLRAAAVAELGFLGVDLDPEANARARADARIGAPGASVRTVVVTAREDVGIARETRETVG
ncbi:acetate/propionate family kinase [Embleya scabrispora]|uniref:acetate/propionate family kinase n=1 Tax=Embleya scabrispora TaxID=159449 RepID=UPI0003AAC26F|nr:acetate/propionate family kinase [Embleya scabrispora]MYS86055.1 acetate/propionate family kinase [Streptomyces sp. SID5474]